MSRIPDGSVDMILTDPPYGITKCTWDKVLPLELMWKQYLRVAKKNAAIVLFGDGPFSTQLINSNPKHFRYKWIWDKARGNNFQNAKKMPMKTHEEVLVFYQKPPKYNPQWWYSTPYQKVDRPRAKPPEILGNTSIRRSISSGSLDGRRYPVSILTFPRDSSKLHPTQKPVALLEYLIKTYTDNGEIVLDSTFGSGSTLVAAKNVGRRYIGFELDKNYFTIAKMRLEDAPKVA